MILFIISFLYSQLNGNDNINPKFIPRVPGDKVENTHSYSVLCLLKTEMFLSSYQLAGIYLPSTRTNFKLYNWKLQLLDSQD